MPAGHPDVVREQVAWAVTAEEPVDLRQQFLDRTRLARHRLGPRHARQGFRPGGQIGRRIAVQHVQGADFGGQRAADVCGRDMTHTIERLVVGDDGAAFVQACRFPSGAQVRCIAVLDLTDGLITRQSGVQAWDE